MYSGVASLFRRKYAQRGKRGWLPFQAALERTRIGFRMCVSRYTRQRKKGSLMITTTTMMAVTLNLPHALCNARSIKWTYVRVQGGGRISVYGSYVRVGRWEVWKVLPLIGFREGLNDSLSNRTAYVFPLFPLESWGSGGVPILYVQVVSNREF